MHQMRSIKWQVISIFDPQWAIWRAALAWAFLLSTSSGASPTSLPIQGTVKVQPIVLDSNLRDIGTMQSVADRLLTWSQDIYSQIGLTISYDMDAMQRPVVLATAELGSSFKGPDGI